MKKRISLILVFAMLVSLIVPFTIPTVSASASAIYNQTDLAGMSTSGSYYLANDITISGTWTGPSLFAGEFDGQGHTITFADGVTINGGLFKSLYIKAYVHDFYVVQAGSATWNYNPGDTGSCTGNLGGVAAYATANANYGNASYTNNAANKIRFENIVVTADILVSSKLSSGQEAAGIGGIVGEMNTYTEITNCVFNGSITDTYDHSKTCDHGDATELSSYGGIAGIAFRSGTLIITECINNGNITGKGNQGGILGAASPVWNNAAVFNTTIQRCVNNGTITSNGTGTGSGGKNGTTVGGIAGWVYAGDGKIATIQNNINRGILAKSSDAKVFAAGIVARLRRSSSSVNFNFLGNLQLSSVIVGNQIVTQQDGGGTVVFTKNYARGAGGAQYTQFDNYPDTYSDLNSTYSGVFVLTLDQKVKLAWERFWDSAGGKLPTSYFASNQISNQADLSSMSPTGSYTLANDITLTGTWKYDLAAFSGTLNGNGHTITIANGTTITGGLFMELYWGAYIHDLKIVQAGSATWEYYTEGTGEPNGSIGGVAAFVGSKGNTTEADLKNESNRVRIANVTATVNISKTTAVSGDSGEAAAIGGIVGSLVTRTEITRCTVTGTISDTYDHAGINTSYSDSTERSAYGGIVGAAFRRSMLIVTECINNANVTGKGQQGGILGASSAHDNSENVSTVTIQKCINTGTITCNGTALTYSAGGIAGYIFSQYMEEKLLNNINRGNVARAGNSACAAGIVAHIRRGQHYKVQFLGNVQLSTNIAGNNILYRTAGSTGTVTYTKNYGTGAGDGGITYNPLTYTKNHVDAMMDLNASWSNTFVLRENKVTLKWADSATFNTITSNIGSQKSNAVVDSKRSIRFVAGTTNNLTVDSVGIEMTVFYGTEGASKTFTGETTKVHGSIYAAGEKVTAASQGVSYLYTATLDHVPTSLGEVTLLIRTFHKDGGQPYYSEYTAMVLDIES